MKNYSLTDKQKDIEKQLKAAGFESRWWGRSDTAERIYFNGHNRRDVKVWIDFDDPNELEGACLRVSIADCGQAAAWYSSQKRLIMEQFSNAFQIVTGQYQAECDELAVSEAEAELWRPGMFVELYTGGGEGDLNMEMSISGAVKSVQRRPAEPGTIGDADQLFVEIELNLGGGVEELYSWRGVMRYRSGAQVVRSKPLEE